MAFWTKQSVKMMYDEVLIRSAMEFRQALEIMERNGISLDNPYFLEIKRGLSLMEKELRQRELELSSQYVPEAPLSPKAQRRLSGKSRV